MVHPRAQTHTTLVSCTKVLLVDHRSAVRENGKQANSKTAALTGQRWRTLEPGMRPLAAEVIMLSLLRYMSCSNRQVLRCRLALGELAMTVSLQPLPQQPAPPPELGTLHILGFLPLSDVGCPPLAARYRVRPEASAGAGAGLGELPPLFPCLLDYLLGGRLAAEARSLCSRPGRAPPEPSEPSAAVVRTAGSMLGCALCDFAFPAT